MTRRLLTTYLTITLLTLVVLVVPLGREFADHARDQLLRDIERDAVVVGSLAEEPLEAGVKPRNLDRVLAQYAKNPGGRIVIVDRHGTSVLDSAGRAGQSFSSRPEVAAALQGHRASGTRHSTTLHADLVYVAVPVASGGVVRGAVRITYPSEELDSRVRSNWWRLGVLSAIVLALVAGVGFALARGVTRPVRQLRNVARTIAGGNLAARAATDDGPPELRDLAATFNDTTARLEELVDGQRALIADASHQLRTPLGVLRLRIDNLAAELPEATQPRIAAIRSELARLTRLVDALLALARAEGGRPELTALDAAAILRSRVHLWEALAADNDVSLHVDTPDNTVWVDAEAGAIEQIIDNLLDNALEVAPQGSRIELGLRTGGASVELHVIDAGPGLSAENREKAFERFWRAPSAPPGGTGLGLAVVQQLARRSHATAELLPSASGGIDAVVTFRAAMASPSAATPR